MKRTPHSIFPSVLLICLIFFVFESSGSTVHSRVKRGGKGRSARMGSGGGHSYGIASMASMSGSGQGKKTVQVDPLTLILGAKALALKVYVISQFLTTTTTPATTVAAG